MANVNGTAEVAKTPSKEQDANEQVEATEEEGANGQLPDSMYSSGRMC
jgi:protein TIF31